VSIRQQPRRWYLILHLVPSIALAVWIERTQAWHPVAAWWVACNLMVFPIWAYDKWQARRDGWRVPEASLHTIAILGAAPASLVAQKLLRHKTLKPVFQWLYWTLTVAQVAGCIYWFGVRQES
jgi:uncharacterized membrane protein YsdA (DUF1294 family)